MNAADSLYKAQTSLYLIGHTTNIKIIIRGQSVGVVSETGCHAGSVLAALVVDTVLTQHRFAGSCHI